MATDNRPLVLVSLCGGGWHRESLRILEHLSPEVFRFAYAYGHCLNVHGAANLPMPHPGPRYPIHYPGRTRSKRWGRIQNLFRLAAGFIDAFWLVYRLRPAAVLVVGSATALPLLTAGRMFGARGIFVESLTRVRQLSKTGRAVKKLRLADRVYVQWPELAQGRGIRYAGAVL